jgi:plastocyanin
MIFSACLSLLAFLAVGAQTVVTTYWPLNKSVKDMAVGTAAWDDATAATFSYEGTALTGLFSTSVAVGSKLAFQAVITPSSYATKEVTGLALLRFKVQGAADGTDDYGVTCTVRPAAEVTFVPTRVSVSVASWIKDTKPAFEVELRKLSADGLVCQTYLLGTVASHAEVDAHYDDVTFDVPSTATASSDAWQVVVRMAAGYANGKNLAIGNVKLLGTATLGGTVETCSFKASVTPADAGSVTPATTEVVRGDNVSCTAMANVGYAFEGWYVDGTKVAGDNPHTFSLSADLEAEARFTRLAVAKLVFGTQTPLMGSVSATADGADIASVFSQESVTMNAGTTVSMTAKAAKGHYFVGWKDADGNILSTTATYTFTLEADRVVLAQFAMIDNFVADLIAFPGAEGYGRFTTGGRMTDQRGSKVYYVTRLDDCTDDNLIPGTLRWALRTGDDTPRTVLFAVCGTIYLTSKLALNHPNVTIAGQTAPGGGICIAGYQLKLSQPNVIIRHIRFRSGDLTATSMSPLDIENTHHVILDHCSLSWSMEENLTLYDCDSTTVQWCISAEGLYYSKNVKGERSYAMQWGGEHGTMHHCLITNSMSRTPRFNGVRPNTHDRQADNEFANNVIFNWGSHNSVYGGECSTGNAADYNRVYMISNYFRPGPATKTGAADKRYFVSASGDNIDLVGQWYLEGNKFETSSRWAPSSSIWADDVLQAVNDDNYYAFTDNAKNRAMNFWSVSPSQQLADKALLMTLPYALSGMTYETADEAFRSVTTQAGASLPRYDEVDSRLLAEAAGTKDPVFCGSSFDSEKNPGTTITPALGIINSPSDITLERSDEVYAKDENTGQTVKTTMWPWLGMTDGEQLMTDTDRDGLPDDYERSIGLDAADATDSHLLTASGYSHLEVFLNGVADGTIDLAPYKSTKTGVHDVKQHHVLNGDNESSRRYYDLQGRQLPAPVRGVYIVGNSKRFSK